MSILYSSVLNTGYLVSYCLKCSIPSLLSGLSFHNQKFSLGMWRTGIYFNPSAWDEIEAGRLSSHQPGPYESLSQKGIRKELHVGWIRLVASGDEDQESSLKSQKENSI